MATKLHGLINLSRIPKECITTNANGEKVLWVDILENKNGADQYGNTHCLTVYNKNAEAGKQTVYLGNFKPQEFGQGTGAAAPAPAAPKVDEDLPF